MRICIDWESWTHFIDDRTRFGKYFHSKEYGRFKSVSVLLHEPLAWIMNSCCELLRACWDFTALLGCLVFVHCHAEAQQSPPNKRGPEEKLLILWLCFDLPFSFSLQLESSGFDRREKRAGSLWLVRATRTCTHTLPHTYWCTARMQTETLLMANIYWPNSLTWCWRVTVLL